MKLNLKTNGKVISALKQILLAIGLLFTFLPFLSILRSDLLVVPGVHEILTAMLEIGSCLLMFLMLIAILFSQYSPIRILAVRKKLILFTRLFIKSKEMGIFIHSVTWKYSVKGQRTIIDLYPNGLVKDTADLGRMLAEYMGETLLKYEESDGKARYIIGISPQRHDGIALLGEGITELDGRYRPNISYDPIPIYDDVFWDFCSEALHIILIAPTGAGKSMFLHYLVGMALKRQHRVFVVDAKNSQLGRFFRHIGITVAVETHEIIELLRSLVQEMEDTYSRYFSSGEADIDANFSTFGLKGYFLFFDEVLAALKSANRKERDEMIQLLSQIALKGRAAGFAMVITAQKLQAEDLPKSITEQCQTRIVLGSLVSEETFHQATGLYKKDLACRYSGGVGKGYAVTPQVGMSYIMTPRMSRRSRDYMLLLKELRDRGIPDASY